MAGGQVSGDDRRALGRDHFGGLALACSTDRHSFAYMERRRYRPSTFPVGWVRPT